MKFSRVAIVVVLFLYSLFFVGCGSGGLGGSIFGGGSSQVLLGPIIGASVTAYRISDLSKSIEGPVITSTDVSSLEKAGLFSLNLNGIPDNELILVTIEGGEDIDADDDGVIDVAYTKNNGTIKLVAKASDIRTGNLKANIFTDIIARQAVEDGAITVAELDSMVRQVLNDVNGDGVVDLDDALVFNPRLDQAKSRIPWAEIKRNAIDLVCQGRGEGAILDSYKALAKCYSPNSSGINRQSTGTGTVVSSKLTAPDGAQKGLQVAEVDEDFSVVTTVFNTGALPKGKTTIAIGGKVLTIYYDVSDSTLPTADALDVLNRDLARIGVQKVGNMAKLTIPKTLLTSIADGNVVFEEDGRRISPTIIDDDPIIGWYFDDDAAHEAAKKKVEGKFDCYLEYLASDGSYKRVTTNTVLKEKATLKVVTEGDLSISQSWDSAYISVVGVDKTSNGGGSYPLSFHATSVNTPTELVLPDLPTWASGLRLECGATLSLSLLNSWYAYFNSSVDVKKSGAIIAKPIIDPHLYSMYASGQLDVTLDSTDQDGNSLKYETVKKPSHGRFRWTGNNKFSYWSTASTDDITLKMRASNGAKYSDVAETVISIFDPSQQLFNFEDGWSGDGRLRNGDAPEGHVYLDVDHGFLSSTVVVPSTSSFSDVRVKFKFNIRYPTAFGSEVANIHFNGINLVIQRRDYGDGGYNVRDGSNTSLILDDVTNGGSWDDLELQVDMDNSKFKVKIGDSLSSAISFIPELGEERGRILRLRKKLWDLAAKGSGLTI